MLPVLILASACLVAYANGANANFKGVASLHGCGTTAYWPAVRWATVATAAGSIASVLGTSVLLQAFSGKGLVPTDLAAAPRFMLAVALGAGIANLLATRLGFPVSTTHMLIGGLIGAGLAANPAGLSYSTLWGTFAKPLLLAPVVAVALGGVLYLLLRAARLAPDQRAPALDSLHYLSAGAVCFARGMNDTPKMAALVAGVAALGARPSLLVVAVCVAIGGLVSARQVADTLSHKITGMNPGQGFAANLATALLVILGTVKGLPLSTTHTSVGALLGIGITTRQAKWRTVIPVLLAWLVTLPAAALLAGLVFKISAFA